MAYLYRNLAKVHDCLSEESIFCIVIALSHMRSIEYVINTKRFQEFDLRTGFFAICSEVKSVYSIFYPSDNGFMGEIVEFW
jgi:hypothetical protein